MRSPTSGPWYFQQVGSPGYFVIKGPNLLPLPETVENARLKAAAPDMAKALRECISSLDYAAMVLQVPEKSAFRESISDARAALAKAGL